LRDNWREEQRCHDVDDVLGHFISNVKLVTLRQSISFSLGEFAVITLAFVIELLQFLNDDTWFEQRQCWSCAHIDGQKHVSFINQSTGIEPFINIISIDIKENQCGVEETQNSQLKADGNRDLGLSLPMLEFRELSDNDLKRLVQNEDQT